MNNSIWLIDESWTGITIQDQRTSLSNSNEKVTPYSLRMGASTLDAV